MQKQRLVVVGNGMAAGRTLEELLKYAPDLYDITVFGAEPLPNYNRILLSPVLSGEQRLSEIILNDLLWYERHGIRLHLNSKVVKLDRTARRVASEDGTVADYERLLLATGSKPVILPLPGRELEGVITYRDAQDTRRMIEAAARFSQAVVIGGGLLGLEAANGLRARWCISCRGSWRDSSTAPRRCCSSNRSRRAASVFFSRRRPWPSSAMRKDGRAPSSSRTISSSRHSSS
jgi:nitrite reductase (NADH) large subunit